MSCLHSTTWRALGVIKANKAFDMYFKKCYPKKGQTIDSYLLQRRQAWAELQDVADKVEMSDSLRAYFLLENTGLAKDDRRQILIANQSSYYIHERERHAGGRDPQGGGKRGTKASRQKGFGRKHYKPAASESSDDDEATEYNKEGDKTSNHDPYAMAVGEGQTPDEGDVSDAHSPTKKSKGQPKEGKRAPAARGRYSSFRTSRVSTPCRTRSLGIICRRGPGRGQDRAGRQKEEEEEA